MRFFQNRYCKLATKLMILGAMFSGTNTSLAQDIVPDNTLPKLSQVKLENNITTITGGAQAGSNLFHSFEKFGLPKGSEAHFNNTVDIFNIITRVTGGSISNIDGLIKANGSANLFLINPAGIIFGKNARLDIGGSFVGTTADAIAFGEDNFFSASNPQNSQKLLNINPNALFFNQLNTTALIENNSVVDLGLNPSDNYTARGLRVPDGRSLLLVGGDVTMDGGGLVALGGRVELGGLAGTGKIGLNVNGNNLSLNFPDAVERSDVSLKNGAGVRVSAGNGGFIGVNARNLDITGESFLLAGIASGQGFGNTNVGNIDINVTDTIALKDNSRIDNQVQPEASSEAGDINIIAKTLQVDSGSWVSAGTFGQGKGGNLTVDAQDIQIIRGEAGRTGLFTQALENSTGDAGDLTINTNTLRVENGALVTAGTFGSGKGGNLTVTASDIQLIGGDVGFTALSTQALQNSKGDAGNLAINTKTLLVKDGAFVGANTFGAGNGGNLTIDAQDIQLIGKNNRQNSGLFAQTFQSSTGNAGDLTIGNAGDLTIKTNTLLVKDEAQVSTRTFGSGKAGNLTVKASDIKLIGGNAGFTGLFAQALPNSTGNAGDLTIKTNTLLVKDGAFVDASTLGDGNGGKLTIDDAQKIELIGKNSRQNSGLFAQALPNSKGNAGDLTIETNTLLVKDGAQINANTLGNGRGGNLTVKASDIQLIATSNGQSNPPSTGLFAKTFAPSTENAGDLTINTNTLVVKNGAQVNASTFGSGRAGDLTVNASDIQLIGINDSFTGLFAEAQQNSTGDAGNLEINTNTLLVKDGAQVNASTFFQGKGGNLTIDAQDIQLIGKNNRQSSGLFTQTFGNSTANAGDLKIKTDTLLVKDGAQVSASTFFQGKGGNLTIDAQDIQLIGKNNRQSSGLFTQTFGNSTANAGDLKINTDVLQVENGATVSVQSLGAGSAGNLTIDADSIRLNNDASLTANNTGINKVDSETEQATININSRDLILRHGSEISTNATAVNIQGGNININSDAIAAFENSDISANSENFRGGNVKIQSQGIFGTQFREEETDESDITATGANPELSGSVEINGLQQNPAQVLTQLPSVPVEGEVKKACQPNTGENQSELFFTGNGGLPPNPRDYLNSEQVDVGWVSLPQESREQERTRRQGNEGKVSTRNRIVEATRLVVDKNGDVFLVAQVPHSTANKSGLNNLSCLKN